jgi:low affinity Fe/Cu permease
VKRDDAAQDRRSNDGRNAFERFVEWGHRQASSAPFFAICLVVVVGWALSAPLWPNLKEWQYVIHTTASVVTLLLLALLENSGRRAEEAAQEKLNVLAEALAELMESRAADDPRLNEATRKLRDAVGLEERH